MILAYYRSIYICKNHAKFGIFMKKSEYFKEISEIAKAKRSVTGEFTVKELGIFRAGEKNAFFDILKFAFPEIAKKYEEKLYSRFELQNILIVQIRNLQEKLRKARRIYKQQQKELQNLRQADLFEEK
jgi:hypothetical protein